MQGNKLPEHFLTAIFGKNREFWKVLEPIRALQTNRMGIHIFAFLSGSYICSLEKLAAEEVIYFLCFLVSFFRIKIVSSYKL